jgi:hypothetical protein
MSDATVLVTPLKSAFKKRRSSQLILRLNSKPEARAPAHKQRRPSLLVRARNAAFGFLKTANSQNKTNKQAASFRDQALSFREQNKLASMPSGSRTSSSGGGGALIEDEDGNGDNEGDDGGAVGPQSAPPEKADDIDSAAESQSAPPEQWRPKRMKSKYYSDDTAAAASAPAPSSSDSSREEATPVIMNTIGAGRGGSKRRPSAVVRARSAVAGFFKARSVRGGTKAATTSTGVVGGGGHMLARGGLMVIKDGGSGSDEEGGGGAGGGAAADGGGAAPPPSQSNPPTRPKKRQEQPEGREADIGAEKSDGGGGDRGDGASDAESGSGSGDGVRGDNGGDDGEGDKLTSAGEQNQLPSPEKSQRRGKNTNNSADVATSGDADNIESKAQPIPKHGGEHAIQQESSATNNALPTHGGRPWGNDEIEVLKKLIAEFPERDATTGHRVDAKRRYAILKRELRARLPKQHAARGKTEIRDQCAVLKGASAFIKGTRRRARRGNKKGLSAPNVFTPAKPGSRSPSQGLSSSSLAPLVPLSPATRQHVPRLPLDKLMGGESSSFDSLFSNQASPDAADSAVALPEPLPRGALMSSMRYVIARARDKKKSKKDAKAAKAAATEPAEPAGSIAAEKSAAAEESEAAEGSAAADGSTAAGPVSSGAASSRGDIATAAPPLRPLNELTSLRTTFMAMKDYAAEQRFNRVARKCLRGSSFGHLESRHRPGDTFHTFPTDVDGRNSQNPLACVQPYFARQQRIRDAKAQLRAQPSVKALFRLHQMNSKLNLSMHSADDAAHLGKGGTLTPRGARMGKRRTSIQDAAARAPSRMICFGVVATVIFIALALFHGSMLLFHTNDGVLSSFLALENVVTYSPSSSSPLCADKPPSCLHARDGWSDSYTCSNSGPDHPDGGKNWCETHPYSRDMKACCPVTCGTGCAASTPSLLLSTSSSSSSSSSLQLGGKGRSITPLPSPMVTPEVSTTMEMVNISGTLSFFVTMLSLFQLCYCLSFVVRLTCGWHCWTVGYLQAWIQDAATRAAAAGGQRTSRIVFPDTSSREHAQHTRNILLEELGLDLRVCGFAHLCSCVQWASAHPRAVFAIHTVAVLPLQVN